MESSYSASLYALLSDKVRERNGAINTLRSILPLEVKRPEFTNDTAENVLKSFLNWLQAELRIARKSSTAVSSLLSALKELKWIISLLDVNFPRIDLSGIVLELIDRLTDVLCSGFGGFMEIIYILNQQILCKRPYLKLIRESKLAARSNRLITLLYEQVQLTESPDALIKTLSFLAISLPESLKLEPLTYKMLHESFIWYIGANGPKLENTTLPSTVNSLLLDYFEHSRKFGVKYFEYFLPLLKCKNNLIVFSKAVEYFSLILLDLKDGQKKKLALLLEKELEESQNLHLFSVDPVTFCRQVILLESSSNLLEITRFQFLKLCISLELKVQSVHLDLFKALQKSTRKTESEVKAKIAIENKKIRNSLEWTALLQFHYGKVVILAGGSKSINWYKLWYISSNSKEFEESVKMEELDEFVSRSLQNEPHLDSLATDALLLYFRLRFKNLWWTSTAKMTFQSFLDCALNTFIETQKLDWSIRFFACLFAPWELNFKYTENCSLDDPKALNCNLFFNRLSHLEQVRNYILDMNMNGDMKISSNKAVSSIENGSFAAENTVISPVSLLSNFYLDALMNFSVGLKNILSESEEVLPITGNGNFDKNQLSTSTSTLTSNLNHVGFYQKYLTFLIGLLDNNDNFTTLSGNHLSWISDLSPNSKRSSFPAIIPTLTAFANLIAAKIDLNHFLSILFTKLPESTEASAGTDSIAEFDDFRIKSSQFEVNLVTAELFKYSTKNGHLIFHDISLIFYFAFSSSTSTLKGAAEELKILNDWKIYMIEVLGIELIDECGKDGSLKSGDFDTLKVADFLRECKPFFDFPFTFDQLLHADPSILLPNPLTVSKKLSTTEQWIPFIFLLLKSSKSSYYTITIEWLIECFQSSQIEPQSLLHGMISNNLPRALANDLLLNWILKDLPIIKFPFNLIAIDPCDFILKCPHFPLILSKFPSIDALIQMFHGSDENENVILSNSTELFASGLLEDASAKLSNRKSVDFTFLNTPSIKSSIKFLPVIVALLSHGQWYPWSVVVVSLQFLAKIHKLSAASDFSELFNPIHSILILRNLIPKIHSADFLNNLFTSIPILTHHPQLLKLTLKLIKSGTGEGLKDFISKYKIIEEEIISEDNDIDDSFANTDLLGFILSYGHLSIFSTHSFSQGIFELIYRLLNLPNVTGNRSISLDSIESLNQSVKDDLKMFVLPLGSRVICFETKSKLDRDVNVQSIPRDLTPGNLCKYLLNQNESSDILTHLLIELLERGSEEFDYGFLKFIIKKSLESLYTKPSSFKILPELIKNLIESLNAYVDKDKSGSFMSDSSVVCSFLNDILHLIIEMTPIGPNLANTILRRFNFDSKVFKILQKANKSTSFYYFSLIGESPKLSNFELDLETLSNILEVTEGGQEYFAIVKKRLSKFEEFENEWPIDVDEGSSSRMAGLFHTYNSSNNASAACWMDRKWFDQNDFNPKNNLNLKQFKEEASNLVNFYNILHGKLQGNNTSTSIVFEIFEDCLKNKKSPNLKEILKIASVPSKLNFQTISLLALCTPKMEQVSRHLLADMSSKLYWERGKLEEALETAKRSLKIFPTTLSDESKALLLSRIGEWAAASKSERPSHILSQYLEKAMTLCENTSTFSPASLAQIHIKVARFVDDQYQQIKESEDFKTRAKILDESRIALIAARNNHHLSGSQDRRLVEISISTLRSQFDLDMQEFTERSRALNSFLLKSVQNYISALSFGVTSANDQMAAISRLCALWFSNSEFDTINDLINNSISSGASSKRSLPLQLFLPLIYQLAARASYDYATKTLSPFQRTLIRLLVQLTINFPFDCIYQLLALRAGNTEDRFDASGGRKRRLLESSNEADLRAAAASLIIDQTRKVSNSFVTTISAVECIVEAYIELANAEVPPHAMKSSSKVEFSHNLKIRRLLYPLPAESPLRLIPIPTGPVEGEHFAGFIDGYKLLGGINLPKQIEAVSSSGSRLCQLVKGKDDVRQDAVMEQVFLRVNKLLLADNETRGRGLKIRTYRVIPLRPLVGLLEWVSDSIPLASYLSEAHERLRPGDLHPSKCIELIKTESARPGSTVQSKLNVLLKEVGQRFRPVLRHFFFEHFNVNGWWTAKQAYTSSLATASIVGWIVGLGDRHGMNILLDKKTGQVVHIDLNMIFEAGRTLRIPERVPFRLTPDCVDGLGPEGIGLDGPFKNHAIAALKVLRKERSLLMMIMDVFKYDPLQKWTGIAKAMENNKPIVGSNTNNNNNNNNNTTTTTHTVSSSSDLITKEADRALMRIKEKLDGREEGVVLSEAGHVAFLIQTATDPELLCQMYFGWQAYF